MTWHDSAEQLLVYQVVEKAGNKGIWHKDIRSQTSLQQPVRCLVGLRGGGMRHCVWCWTDAYKSHTHTPCS